MLKNHDKIVAELATLIYELDIQRLPYEVDVYLYVDEEGNGTLKTFNNIGHTSWLNDDHITIYTCLAWVYGDSGIFEEYQAENIAYALNMNLETLKEKAAEYHGCTVEEIDKWKIEDYVENDDDLMALMIEDYNEGLKDQVDYTELAENVLERYYEESRREIK